MSGGHFQYQQDKIMNIIEDIEGIIKENDDTTLDEWGGTVGRGYSPEVIEKLKEGVGILKAAFVYANRIDWLLSDDDGEESFLERLEEELRKI